MATSLGLLRNLWQFNNQHAYLYKSWNVSEDWFSSCGEIWRYRPISGESQHNFHFLPHLNSKTTEPIFTIFTRCRAICVAINAFIHRTIVHLVLKCQGAECGSFCKFCPKLVAMARSLEISKKRSRSIIYSQNAFIWCKDCENRSSESWMPVCQMNEYRTISAHFSISTPF